MQFPLGRLDQVDIGDSVVVPDVHHPVVVEEFVVEIAEVDEGGRKPQFLQTAHHGFG